MKKLEEGFTLIDFIAHVTEVRQRAKKDLEQIESETGQNCYAAGYERGIIDSYTELLELLHEKLETHCEEMKFSG